MKSSFFLYFHVYSSFQFQWGCYMHFTKQSITSSSGSCLTMFWTLRREICKWEAWFLLRGPLLCGLFSITLRMPGQWWFEVDLFPEALLMLVVHEVRVGSSTRWWTHNLLIVDRLIGTPTRLIGIPIKRMKQSLETAIWSQEPASKFAGHTS